MLVLTRKRSEAIKIGEDIVIKVIQTGRGSVKLGIEAPGHVRVLRAELSEFSSAPESQVDSGEHENPPPAMTSEQFLMEFNAEYVGELEDQLLLSVAL